MDIPYFKTEHEFDKPPFVFGEALREGQQKDDYLCHRVNRAFDRVSANDAFGLIFCSFRQAQILIQLVKKKRNHVTQSQIFVYRGKLSGPPRNVDSNQLPRNTVETAVILKKGKPQWASFQPFKGEEDTEDPTDLGNLFLSPRDFKNYPSPTNSLPFRKPADLLAKFLEAYSIVDAPVLEAFSGN